MRIVLVFLMLVLVSAGGLGILFTNVTRGGGPLVGGVPADGAPAQPAAQPEAKPTAAPPGQAQPPAPVPAGAIVQFTIGQGRRPRPWPSAWPAWGWCPTHCCSASGWKSAAPKASCRRETTNCAR